VAIAVKPKKTFDYILKDDRKAPSESQTVWKLRGLSISEQTDVQDSLRTEIESSGETTYKTGTLLLKTLRAGLVGVENFRDEEGAIVKFETDTLGMVTYDFLDRLAPAWRVELVNAIASGGLLSEKDRD